MDIQKFLKENEEIVKDLKKEDIQEIVEDFDDLDDPRQIKRFNKQVGYLRKRLKIEEEQSLKREEENRELKELIKKREEENRELRELLKEKNKEILTKNIKGCSYSELFKIKDENHLIKEKCEFKDWDIPSNNKVMKNINLYDCIQESDMQSKLDEYFKDFNKNKELIITNGTRKKIGGLINHKYCDYIINQKGFPLEPYWIHMVGDLKIDSIKSNASLGQVITYIDMIVEKSNHHIIKRPMFAFLINKTHIKFVKYHIEENQYYITIDYELCEGFQYLSDLMIYLQQFIINIPNKLQSKLKCKDSVEFYYGSTSNVFIVNDVDVYKWFNNSFDYENELKYLEFVKGIKGTPSITEQNKKENWIHISPRGHLIKNSNFIDISFYTNSVEILENIHQREVIHRDIRLSNLLKCTDYPLLVDFGFANFTENEDYYKGTINTASNRIYKILINNGTRHAFPVIESDDLESLVKVYMMENEELVKSKIQSIPNPEIKMFDEMWGKFIEQFNQYSSLFQHAQNKNYQELKNEFINFDKNKNKNTTTSTTNTNTTSSTNTNTTSTTNTNTTSSTNTNTTSSTDTNTTSTINTNTTSTTNTNTTSSDTTLHGL
ncbi:hypothetical protein ACTFIZ_006295 [Dictyostelium cf. discoideum]